MSPRPYQRGQRQMAVEQTRSRILAAARDLLMTDDGFAKFSIDAVARQAGVARMTVYYQFGAKVGLLEALFDSLAVRRGAEQLVVAVQQPDPRAALTGYITTIVSAWDADRRIYRLLHGLAALDPDFEQVWRLRMGRRREGLRAIARRMTEQYSQSVNSEPHSLHALHRYIAGMDESGPQARGGARRRRGPSTF